MFLAKVYVTYKESILDPKGQAVKDAIHHLGFDAVQSVRMGKYFEIVIDATEREQVEAQLHDVCDRLLANVTMETFRFELEEA